MDTAWTHRRPLECEAKTSIQPVLDEDGEPSVVLLVGDLRVPDRVRAPDDPAMGEDAGQVLAVTDSWVDRCRHPACAEKPHDVRFFALERGWFVGECGRTGFAWMRQENEMGPRGDL